MRLEGKKKERRKRPREDDEPKAFCYGRRCYGCGSRGDCRLRRRLASSSSSSSSPKKFDKKNERLIDRKKRAGKKISKKNALSIRKRSDCFLTQKDARAFALHWRRVASIPRALSTKKKTRHLSAHTHDSRSSLLLFLSFCDIYIYIYIS